MNATTPQISEATQIWPTRWLRLPGFSFQTGHVFGTVIRLGSSHTNLTLTIGRCR